MKGVAKTRLQTTRQTLLKNQINARPNQIKIQIRQVDAAVAEKVAQDEALSNKLAILISIPGIAETTAFSMLIEMPELGTLEGKQAASLAGLAPMSRQSGKWQGKERIQGGRAFLRRAISMPALVATRHDPGLEAKYDQLIRAGKSGKARSYSDHEKAHRNGKCAAARRPRNGQNLGLDQNGYSSSLLERLR